MDKEETSPVAAGEVHGRCVELGDSIQEPPGVWGAVR